MIKAETLDAILPQTQCGECGFAGCKPYAEAMALGQAPIDRCPPGGIKALTALGKLLSIDPAPYLESVQQKYRAPTLAVIREPECIGCTKCIQACPVDAIIGSAKQMHTIITHECTGCGLCVEPCPVDCIDLVSTPNYSYDSNQARRRYESKQARLLHEKTAKQKAYQEKRRLKPALHQDDQDQQAKLDFILQAVSRVKHKINTVQKNNSTNPKPNDDYES